MSPYAESTTVSPERSQQEISGLLRKFLAHIVLPDGRTVAQMVVPEVAAAYEQLTTPHRLLALPAGES